MLQYVKELVDRLDSKKLEQIKQIATSKEGVIGITASIVLSTAYSYHRYTTRPISKGCPLVPYTLPFVGSTLEYRKDPEAFCKKWHDKLGPVFRAHLFGKEVTVVGGHEVKEVFLNKHFDFLRAVDKTFNLRLLTNGASPENFAPDPIRKLVTKYLTPNLDIYTERVVKRFQEGVNDFLGGADSKDLPHVYPLVQHMIAKASASIFVGEKLADNPLLIDSFKNMVIDVGSELTPNPWIEPFPLLVYLRMWYIGKTAPSCKKHKDQLRKAIGPELEDRLYQMKNNPQWEKPDDILQRIIEEEDLIGDSYIECVVDLITALIFASIHTTSEASTVVLYRILANPEIVDELRKEQEEVFREEGTDKNFGAQVFTRDIIKKFVKLDSVCREASRLKSEFIKFGHEYDGPSPITLSNGAIISPGDDVLIDLWKNHRDSEIQHGMEDPCEFKPFRFVNADKQSTKVGEDYLVFGMGRHACPGRWFAMQEVQTIVSMLIREYDIKSTSPVGFPTDDRSLPYGMFRLEKRKT
ncbi:cytochrome P450 [Phycomyces nitens]|nr:cytochrome P450 [Phycomyces nitens]